MPEIKVVIGGRTFDVACQEGEEHYLQSAARMLDTEAAVLVAQIGRLPESRMLLMAGLMLADKTAGMEEQVRASEATIAQLQAQLTQSQAEAQTLRNAPPPPAEKVEVPVIPAALVESMAEMAARAEAIAQDVEERANT
ncbi:cell division protein ZapA [Oceaniglobus ichthyenteri]|uniref:cell division protein ZapA n=1 Tax=Oceaniglobus ichthyenteri TaxID=2136177 RepID=UPI000D3CC5BF|nr:cell division protein ZapA [Oceaniglobus ichthyenteri]